MNETARHSDAPHNKVYRASCSVYLFFVAAISFFCPLFPSGASAGTDTAYLDGLIASAREKRLSEDRYWDILLHYKSSGGGRKSLVDDPRYFLSPDGKTDPQAELDAMLAAMFDEGHPDEEHPRCRFIARDTWLRERLSIDEGRLPAIRCAKFDEAVKAVNPKSAVLVFPATHNNSPASMFGHTLIRIDSTYQSDLLSHAVNYAAVTDDTSGILYAFKGLFGLYRGYFSILPYYEKVKEYNSLEHRDMWEYQLNLTEEETRRMLLHIWELKDIYSDYFFFDENCSYDLLFLIEAARPSVRLTDEYRDRFKFWVIPSDTIRTVRENGLVENVKYRPSQATRILFIASRLENGRQKAARDVAMGKAAPQSVAEMDIPAEEKMMVLDLAAEFVQFRVSRKEIEKDDYLKQFLAILNVRSGLGRPAADPAPVAAPPRPDNGHLPGKFGLGAGYRTDSFFTEVTWRAAYHDLMDPDDGYIEGSQINFFDVAARYYFNDESLRLHSFRLIDIVSLSPRDEFFKPVSWKVNTGIERKPFRDGKERLIYRVNPGGGFAYKSGAFGIIYGMVETDINLSNVWEDRFAFGIGPSAGALKTVNDAWKISLSARALFYRLGEEHRSVAVSLTQNFKLAVNSGIALSLSREKTFDHYRSEVRVGWNLYF